jgi:hypothetical protein
MKLNDIKKLDKRIEDLEKKREAALGKLQSECKHPIGEVIEAHYRQAGYFGPMPPFRVCKSCGYAEDGWGCGYWKLRNNENCLEVSRDYAQKYILGGINTQNEMNEKRYNR